MEDPRVQPFLVPETLPIGTLKLRPFSAGSFLICQRRKLGLFTGDSTEISGDEQLYQVMAFLYIHSAPMNEVLIAAGNEERFRLAVETFSMTQPIGSIPEAMQQIQALCDQAASASVEIHAKPSSASSETAPPN